jgi:hypothetical protein
MMLCLMVLAKARRSGSGRDRRRLLSHPILDGSEQILHVAPKCHPTTAGLERGHTGVAAKSGDLSASAS